MLALSISNIPRGRWKILTGQYNILQRTLQLCRVPPSESQPCRWVGEGRWDFLGCDMEVDHTLGVPRGRMCVQTHAMQWVPTHVCRPLRGTLGREEGASEGSLSYTCPGVMRPLLAGPGNRGSLQLKGGPYLAARAPFRRLPGGTALSPWGSRGWSEPCGGCSVASHQDWQFHSRDFGGPVFFGKEVADIQAGGRRFS